MFWAKQTLVDLKIEHSFCYYSNLKQVIIFSSFWETYSVLIRKLYLGLCVVRISKKGSQNAQNKIFCDRKTSAAILFPLLVGYELICY